MAIRMWHPGDRMLRDQAGVGLYGLSMKSCSARKRICNTTTREGVAHVYYGRERTALTSNSTTEYMHNSDNSIIGGAKARQKHHRRGYVSRESRPHYPKKLASTLYLEETENFVPRRRFVRALIGAILVCTSLDNATGTCHASILDALKERKRESNKVVSYALWTGVLPYFRKITKHSF